jgi:hypothetical protein
VSAEWMGGERWSVVGLEKIMRDALNGVRCPDLVCKLRKVDVVQECSVTAPNDWLRQGQNSE